MDEPPAVEAVAAMYSADRADLASLDSTTTNLIAISIAYIAATIAFLPSGSSGLDGWATAAVPVPIVLLSSYWLTLLNMIAARALSARQLEILLHAYTGCNRRRRATVGLEAVEPFMNLGLTRGFSRLILLIHYGGAAALVTGHAVIMLARAWSQPHGAAAVLTLGTVYILVGVCCVGAQVAYHHKISALEAELTHLRTQVH